MKLKKKAKSSKHKNTKCVRRFPFETLNLNYSQIKKVDQRHTNQKNKKKRFSNEKYKNSPTVVYIVDVSNKSVVKLTRHNRKNNKKKKITKFNNIYIERKKEIIKRSIPTTAKTIKMQPV